MPEPIIQTYYTSLNSLDEEWAEFVCADMVGGPDLATLTVRRGDWEKASRPVTVAVRLEQYVQEDEFGLVTPSKSAVAARKRVAPREPFETDPF